MFVPDKPPMLTIVDIVEQGRFPILLLSPADEESSHKIGHASRLSLEHLRGPGHPACTGNTIIVISLCY